MKPRGIVGPSETLEEALARVSALPIERRKAAQSGLAVAVLGEWIDVFEASLYASAELVDVTTFHDDAALYVTGLRRRELRFHTFDRRAHGLIARATGLDPGGRPTVVVQMLEGGDVSYAAEGFILNWQSLATVDDFCRLDVCCEITSGIHLPARRSAARVVQGRVRRAISLRGVPED